MVLLPPGDPQQWTLPSMVTPQACTEDELTLDDMFYSYFDEWSMSSEFDEITEILGYSDGSWRLYTSGECGFLFARKTP
jgi:hypothetical protein